ncbi:helicase-associated domain-containing protein [Streptomyces lavenduligriseus]|uniref:Helicase-associated domain-containing protein n=1 Tax=Streptomyces lavenduligriseus TaxID=67315 RepID=A0ABT0P5Y3_9ACTN|nr:helicase-associated domain-containing protein [Streptomyces lavenduligriseus]MCL3998993.1 helicase-associated domain-containing protein [Streptomyces lavenduligriseus]
MSDSNPSAVDHLCDHLRTLGPRGLAQLLAERRDALTEPRPRTLREIAERLLRPGSVQRAATQLLSLPCVEVAEALAALPTPCPRPLLASMLGVPLEPGKLPGDGGAGLEQALGRLSALGLVWARDAACGEQDSLIMAEALRELWKEPLGLGNRLVGFATVVENLHGEGLAAALDALALTAEGSESEQRAALLTHHRDGQRVRDLVAQAPAPAQELLKHLSRSNSTTYSSISMTYAGQEGQDWAAERALLSSKDRPVSPGSFGFFGERETQLPAEVLIALRGPEPAAPFHPQPPQIPLTAVSGQQITEAASTAAVTFLAQAATVLHACVQQPPALLKDGGIGTRELTRITKASGCTPAAVRLVLECAHAAGLLAHDGQQRILATTGYDAWTARDPARQYTQLALAWHRMRFTPTRTTPIATRYGTDDDAPDGPTPALASRAECEGCRATRTALLDSAAALGPQQALDTTGDLLGAFADLLAWHRPRARFCACTERYSYSGKRDRDHEKAALAPLVREAELLGVLAQGALSPLGAALRHHDTDPALKETELAACAQQVLPPPAETARFHTGPDVTAIVDGVCSPRLAALLDQLADRAVRHPASLWHITPASLRRALDTGHTADELLHVLRSIADTTALPERLTERVRDAADAHGRVRLTTPASLLHSTDTALIAEIAASDRLPPLSLRVLAPTVLTSPLPGDTVLAALRDAGYAPVYEEHDGAIRLERPTLDRHPLLPAPRTTRPAPEAPDIADLAEALLSATGDKTVPRFSLTEQVLARDAQHLDPPALRRLAHAIDNASKTAITYAPGAGRPTAHTIHSLELDPPYLYARTGTDDEVNTFHLSHIHDVDTEAPA